MDYCYYPGPAAQPPGDPYQYDLRWIVSQIQSLKAFTGDLAKSVGAQSGNIEGLNLAQKQLCEAQEAINHRLDSGDFENASFGEWAAENLPSMVTNMIRFVWFGLTDEGRFCAYVPANWGWLTFNTDPDITSPTYGHLIITY